jgi:hypothetical protein
LVIPPGRDDCQERGLLPGDDGQPVGAGDDGTKPAEWSKEEVYDFEISYRWLSTKPHENAQHDRQQWDQDDEGQDLIEKVGNDQWFPARTKALERFLNDRWSRRWHSWSLASRKEEFWRTELHGFAESDVPILIEFDPLHGSGRGRSDRHP